MLSGGSRTRLRPITQTSPNQLPSHMEFAGGAFMLVGVTLVRIDETKRYALIDKSRVLVTCHINRVTPEHTGALGKQLGGDPQD